MKKMWDVDDAPRWEKKSGGGEVSPYNPEFDLNESIRLRAGSTDARGSLGCQHGEVGHGDLAHARWCWAHGWHGWLYECSYYSDALIGVIRQDQGRWRRNLQDEGWVRKQLERGIPKGLIEVWRAWALEGSQLKDIN